MRRRDALAVLVATIGAAAGRTWAQERVWRVGFLSPRSRPEPLDADPIGGFPRGLRELGYVEGRNLVIEWRFANSDYARLPNLVAELVRARMDVLVCQASPAIRAARRATSTIPIVMASVADPVGAGFVNSLARPGGNVTGLANLSDDVSPKQVELLLAVAPRIARFGVLTNPGSPAHASIVKSIRAAAKNAGKGVAVVEARNPEELDAAFQIMLHEKIGAVIVATDSFMFEQRERIASLAIRARLPLMGPFGHYAEAGGLISYGHDRSILYQRAAIYVDKILRGAKPADLPVEQAEKFELVLNLRTARAIGARIPPMLQGRADKVIE